MLKTDLALQLRLHVDYLAYLSVPAAIIADTVPLHSACRATSEPNSVIQSFHKEIFGDGRGDAYTFSYYSNFHLNGLRDTTSWGVSCKR